MREQEARNIMAKAVRALGLPIDIDPGAGPQSRTQGRTQSR